MILVGEPHPGFPDPRAHPQPGSSAHVRVLGFTPIEDFSGYMAACDIVLNLRYPTVGESSGSLLRALGLGKAVMVSDVGSFRGVSGRRLFEGAGGRGRRGHPFRISEPAHLASGCGAGAGQRARCYVERECNWDLVARPLYARSCRRWWRAGSAAEIRRSSGAARRKQWCGIGRCRARISRGLVAHRTLAGVSGNAQDAPAADSRNHAPGRACRPHSGDGRLPADHARAALTTGLRRGPRLLLWTRGAGGPSVR